MTENEAIKTLEYTRRNCGMPEQGEKWSANRETIALDMAIKAVEEIQQYHTIGTVEECQEARERQRVKQPRIKVQGEDLNIGCTVFKAGTKTYWCPSCSRAITGSDAHCRWCGQAIDWSDIYS